MTDNIWIFKHYLKRAWLNPVGIGILTLMPLALIVILSMVITNASADSVMVNGYNMVTSMITIVMLIMFQFFSGSFFLDWLYEDFVSARKWRLMASPYRLNRFVLAAGLASWVFSLMQGLIIIVVTTQFMDAYLGNPWMVMAVLLLVSTMGVFMHMLFFMITKKKGTAEALSQVVIQGMMMASVWIENFPIENNAIIDFLVEVGTPIALARRAIVYAGFIGNDMSIALEALGIVALITMILVLVVIVLGRRRAL